MGATLYGRFAIYTASIKSYMKYFTALYMMPVEGLDAWMQKPEEERKSAEETMKYFI